MTVFDTDNYRLIYDFLDQPPRLIFPLLFFCFAILGFYLIKLPVPRIFKGSDFSGIKNESKKGIIGLFFIVFGLSLGFWSLNLSDYFKTRSVCKKDDLTIVSGLVTNLIINNKGKNNSMEFYLNGQHFSFRTNYFINYGCTYADLENANIEDSTFLKIAYFVKNGENIVLRVQKKNKY